MASSSSPLPPPDALGTEGSPLPFGSPFATAEVVDPIDTLPGEQPEGDPALQTGLSLWAVVLAGGIGSRFWPLSTPERPKQLLALVGDRPLIAETVARLAPTVPASRVLVLTSADIVDALHAAIPEVPRENMLVEPRPMGTAAALAWGAHEIGRRVGPRTVFCCMHADLAVGFPDELRRLLTRAAALASHDPVLVAMGVEPTRPETGFGYMVPGAPLDPGAAAADQSGGATGGNEPSATVPRSAPYRVARFVEKPGPLLAEELIAQGAFWHSGIVVAQAGTVFDALTEHTPELQPGLAALAAGKLDRFAGMIQSVSVERGLLERCPDVVVLPGDCGWDDVGTWAALRRVRELDDTGNGVWGSAHLVDSSSCVVHSEGDGTIVVYGLSGMLVVSRPGLTFVTTLDRATQLNPLLDALPASLAGRPRRDAIVGGDDPLATEGGIEPPPDEPPAGDGAAGNGASGDGPTP